MHTIHQQKPEPANVTIFLVDDHEVVRHGLMMSLLNFLDEYPQPDMHVQFVGAAKTGEDALAQIPQSGANVAFIDVILPDMSGITLIRRLRQQGLDKQSLRILVVTELTSPNVREIFAVGANGYITKQEHSEVFIKALRSLLSDPLKLWLQPEVARKLLSIELTIKTYGITPTEVDILQLIHLTNPEIAEILGISVGSIRNHISNIYDKLNKHSRKEVIDFACRLELTSLSY